MKAPRLGCERPTGENDKLELLYPLAQKRFRC